MSAALDPVLARAIVCPACRGPLRAWGDILACSACRTGYPVEGGIPVLLVGAARPLDRFDDSGGSDEQQ
jgi:uncharacterized protein YbaR (Trm112 family)